MIIVLVSQTMQEQVGCGAYSSVSNTQDDHSLCSAATSSFLANLSTHSASALASAPV